MSHAGFCTCFFSCALQVQVCSNAIDTVKPSLDNKVVVVLDDHVTHTANIEAIRMAPLWCHLHRTRLST